MCIRIKRSDREKKHMKKTIAFIISILLVVMLLPVSALAATEPPDNCLKIDNGEVATAFGSDIIFTDLTVANVFTGATDKSITSIWFYYGDANADLSAISAANVLIYAVDGDEKPTGDAVYTQAVDVSTLTENAWNEVVLTTAYTSQTDSIAVGLSYSTTKACSPFGMDTTASGEIKSFIYWEEQNITNWPSVNYYAPGISSSAQSIHLQPLH